MSVVLSGPNVILQPYIVVCCHEWWLSDNVAAVPHRLLLLSGIGIGLASIAGVEVHEGWLSNDVAAVPRHSAAAIQ